MKYNIVDIVHLLTLVPNEGDSCPARRMSKSKSTHFANPNNAEIIPRNPYPGTKPTRQSTQKLTKKQSILYEVMDNRKIMIHQNSAACSFTFDRIQQPPNKFENLLNWLVNKNKPSQEMEINVSCKLIVAQNLSRGDCYNFMEGLAKKLISEGLSFEMITKFYTPRQQMCMNRQIHRQRRQSHEIFYDESAKIAGGMNKNIRFMSDLKQYINDIKSLNQSISKLWVLTPIGEFGVGFLWPAANKQSYVNALEQLINSYQLFKELKPTKIVNMKVAISTVCQTPQENIIESCKMVLENSLLIRNQIMKFAVDKKILTNSEKYEQKQNKILKDHTNNQQKSDEKRSRKSSKVQIQQKPLKIQYHRNQNERSDSNSSSSESQKSLVKKSLTNTNKNKGIDISESGIASILAENMNLKWQLTTKEKQFELQSQKFITKMNKKMQQMRQERSFVIQESARLRKDNEALLRQINQIKHEYQQILKTRCDYEKLMEEKIKIAQATTQDQSSLKIKQLSEQVKLLQDLKQNLQAQISNMKISLEDARMRNRDKMEEMTGEMNQYKNFCEELKAAYDDLQRQARLDQDRCQNLQKRCKKYQETLSGLLQIKLGSPSVNLEEVASSKTSFLFEDELENGRKEQQSESRTKIKKWQEKPQKISISRKNQSQKVQIKKEREKTKNKTKQFRDSQNGKVQKVTYERQVTFADSQSKFQ